MISKALSVQFLRHYAVVFLKMLVAFYFGMRVNPDLFGSFIKLSFSVTFFWFVFDFGFKQFALTQPFKMNLNQQKIIHLIGVIPVLFFIASLPFFYSLSLSETVWLVAFAISAFFSAISIPSYVQLYWKGDIIRLAKTDFIVHLFFQPLAILALYFNHFTIAFTLAFIAPSIFHALFILHIAPISFEKTQLKNWPIKKIVPLGATDMLHQIKSKADTLLLSVFLPTSQIGIYNRGYALPHHSNQFIQAVFQPVLLPELARKNKLPIFKTIIYILLSGFVFLLIPVFLNYLIHQFWTASWSDLLPLLPLFVLWAFLQLIAGLHETLFKSRGLNFWVFLRAITFIASHLLLILFFYDDFTLLLSLSLILQSFIILAESLLKIRSLFEFGFLVPISEFVVILLFLLIYF